MHPFRPFRHPRAARGSTLIIAIVLLLLLSLIGLFAARVAISEQRSSGVDLRERIVHQVAEASLSHALEYMRGTSLVPATPGGDIDLTVWQPCLANDTTFPCGAVSPGIATDATRRGRMYRYRGNVDLDGNGQDARERYMLEIPPIVANGARQAFTQVGNFDVRYGVAAVLCTFAADGSCTRTDAQRTGLGTVTLVSYATIPGEDAEVTMSETYGSFRIINLPPNAPPLVAGAMAQGVGQATIVANPNSGGIGVPVSIWTRGPLDADNGSWQTCQLDEYMRRGPATYTGTTNILTCASDCTCGEDVISGDLPRGGDRVIGFDIQTPAGAGNADDFTPDIRPSTYFPCDMFEFVFGVRARSNTNGGAAEAGLPYPICEDGRDADGDGDIDVATAYLEKNAKTIITDCASLNANSKGLIWYRGTGTCQLQNTIGSADDPVTLVSAGDIQLRGATVFGIVFGFNHRNVDLTEGAWDTFTPALDPGGGSQNKVYGAVIVEGHAKFNGNIDIIASPKVIENFGKSRENFRYGVVPGSWTDRVGY